MGQRAAWFGMNLNDLANLGQIIGAVAVVVSLIYVALSYEKNAASRCEADGGVPQSASVPNRCCVQPLLTGKESNESK